MKHFEFWNPRLFELPYYLYLFFGACVRGLPFKYLAKANYGLDHGEIGIGSKYQTQMAFDQQHFLPTALIPASLGDQEKAQLIEEFACHHGYPLVLKSDIGSVGKGVIKLAGIKQIAATVERLSGAYIVQKFTDKNSEFGVFYVRHHGKARITGINKKHFPTITGDGISSILALAKAHPRYSPHWQSFLQYVDVNKILPEGERIQLSFIGSHTLGCKFTNDSYLITPQLTERITAIFESQPGFNFGRLDVKADDDEAFQNGDFVVIEVNGIASLPTHMFDPDNSLLQAYGIFFRHGQYLLDAAVEHRRETMKLDSYANIIKKVRGNARVLNQAHQQLMKQT